MQRLTRALLFLLVLIDVTAVWAAELPAALANLDAYVERVRGEFEVPGLALAIVKDGKVVLAKGYGGRKLGELRGVDEHTLFAIASNTKAFTAAGLALLVEEGKLSWDDPVQKHLPEFQLSDPYIARELTIRDLLTHRSGLGLGAGDLMYWPTSNIGSDEILRQARWVPIEHSLRARYAYVNLLYVVSGQLFPAVTGQRWDTFVRERIFVPLGMTDSRATFHELRTANNVATPHVKADWKTVQPASPTNWDNAGPAGGIWSSAADLAKWMNLHLAGGKLAGAGERRLFSAARQKDMWSIVTPLPINEPPSHLAPLKRMHNGYGLGWAISDYRGVKTISHSGALAGMYSKITLIPDQNLGVVVLTNLEHSAGFQAVSLHVLDAYLGAPSHDWIEAYRTAIAKEMAEHEEDWQKHLSSRATDAPPSLPSAKFAGRYRDKWYGDVIVADEEGRLTIRFSRTPQLVGDLQHWHHDTFLTRWRDRTLNGDAFVTFSLTTDGEIDEMKMEAVSPLTDFSFDFQDLTLKPLRN